ncbi:hypothetical protein MLD38_004877 [Melastoma candidum]|uniref:Uncharacterized protein n=1 Tax=Melastoma candidum TaxID=119954 RepID=A0ACB9S7I6_9MYRT|nr:hypothetical protein MLD38_004877 [Melastoma candidum]
MATFIDSFGATFNYYAAGFIKAAVDLNVSFLSEDSEPLELRCYCLCLKEEVELEARLVGQKERGKVSLGGGEKYVKKGDDGKLIALAGINQHDWKPIQ